MYLDRTAHASCNSSYKVARKIRIISECELCNFIFIVRYVETKIPGKIFVSYWLCIDSKFNTAVLHVPDVGKNFIGEICTGRLINYAKQVFGFLYVEIYTP